MSKVGDEEIANLKDHYHLNIKPLKSRADFLGIFNVTSDPSKIANHKLTDNIEKAQELENYNSRIEELNQWIQGYRYHALNVNTLQDNKKNRTNCSFQSTIIQ